MLNLGNIDINSEEQKMSLSDSLNKISEKIRSQRHLMTTEEAAKEVSVRPFIRALGFDTANLGEVRPEFPILNMDAVDFAIMRKNRPIMFIEAKRVGETLDKHWKQLYQYFNADDAIVGILTNGIAYNFYADLNKSHIMDKQPFLIIEMDNLDSAAVDALQGFTKTRFDPERTIRKLKMFSLVEKEYMQPSDEFVRYFAKQVHSGSLWKEVIQEYVPIVKQAWDDLVDREIARRLRRPPKVIDDSATDNSISPEEQVEAVDPANHSKVEIPIRGYLKKGKYRGHRFEAKMLVYEGIHYHQEVILFLEQLMTPSGAARRGFLNAVGEHPDVNGWWFWKLTDPFSGDERPIKDVVKDENLRNRILKNA